MRYSVAVAAAVHFQDLERLRLVHQRGHVADRPDVDLASRQECHRSVEIDGKPAFDLVEDDALDLLAVVEGFFQLAPAFLTARLVAREHGLAERVLDPLEIDLDRIADLDLGRAARRRKFAQRHAPFGLGPDIDDCKVLLDADDGPLDHGSFLRAAGGEGLFKQLGKIFARWPGGTGAVTGRVTGAGTVTCGVTGGGSHELSLLRLNATSGGCRIVLQVRVRDHVVTCTSRACTCAEGPDDPAIETMVRRAGGRSGRSRLLLQ